MDMIHPLAQEYAEKYTSAPDGVLDELEAQTRSIHPQAHMISGKVQGRFLEMISCMMQPKRILEIGTFTGYSALCLAKGLRKDGQLHTIEVRESETVMAKSYFDLSVWRDQIILHHGNALSIIPELNELWDIVFIDADKVHYIDYYNLVLPKLRPGGVIIADNVLFHGQVLEDPVKGKNAKAMQAFNEYVSNDDSVEKVLLTVRDGILLIRKK
ncbi:MAG: O-methyltransferase [Chitinophagaceae bacterium]|nr:O-methyltransferase [Chitinophagaceae bacterium]